MEEKLDLLEADFLQFYNVDICDIANSRIESLIINLPSESRFIRSLAPEIEWSWSDEMLSRILLAIESLTEIIIKTQPRKKGRHQPKLPELKQFQPEYVRLAKARSAKTSNNNVDVEYTKTFWHGNNL